MFIRSFKIKYLDSNEIIIITTTTKKKEKIEKFTIKPF